MKTVIAAVLCAFLAGCATQTAPTATGPEWSSINETAEAEYAPGATGTGVVTGQAFLTQRGGRVVSGAGSQVSLDPVTAISTEWWSRQARFWSTLPPDYALTDADQYTHAKARMSWAAMTPPSPGFRKARRTVTADAEGRFRFSDVPAGKYYASTAISWIVGQYSYQGGLIGQPVEVRDGNTTEVILSRFP